MKQKIFFLDFKKILPKAFFADRFRTNAKEKGNTPVCPCQELNRLIDETKLISEQLEKLYSGSSRPQELNVEKINVEKIILESLSFNLGNIDVDTINGTMNIGITINLPNGAVSLPEKIQVSDNTTNKSDQDISTVKKTDKKKAAYRIFINPNSSEQEITPKITRVNNNKK